jgi:hypothetical protein
MALEKDRKVGVSQPLKIGAKRAGSISINTAFY